MIQKTNLIIIIETILLFHITCGFVPFIDGGKEMPKLYDGWFNEQIAKQASTAVSKAIRAGYVSIVGVKLKFPFIPISQDDLYALQLLTSSSCVHIYEID